MSELVVTCNICDQEITRIANIHVEYPPQQEAEKAEKVMSAAAKHLEEHPKEQLADHLRRRGNVFWRTTLE